MKKIVVSLLCFWAIQIDNKECIPTTFECAKQYFYQLSTQEIDNIDLATLSDVQFKAFKNLSKDLFHQEVASHKCSSQSNRIKAEIMMQKMGIYY